MKTFLNTKKIVCSSTCISIAFQCFILFITPICEKTVLLSANSMISFICYSSIDFVMAVECHFVAEPPKSHLCLIYFELLSENHCGHKICRQCCTAPCRQQEGVPRVHVMNPTFCLYSAHYLNKFPSVRGICVCVRCLFLFLQWATGEKPAGSRLLVLPHDTTCTHYYTNALNHHNYPPPLLIHSICLLSGND